MPFREEILFILLMMVALSSAILYGWDAKSLCDTEQCTCDAIKSRVTCSCKGDGSRSKPITLQANGTFPLPPSTSIIKVEYCYKVTVHGNAISSLVALRHVEIQHVNHLIIEPHAFSWNHKPSGSSLSGENGLSVMINNASLPELPSYTFQGRHTSIQLQNLKITVIRPYSFANLDNGIVPYNHGKLYALPEMYYTERTIQIKDCHIGSVESLAFRKFSAAEISWSGGSVGAFHSRALLELTLLGFDIGSRGGVTRAPGTRPGLGTRGGLRMDNIMVGKIDSSAFYLSRLSALHFQNVTFVIFDRGAIRATVDSPLIRNCYFGKLGSGAFLALIPDRGIGSFVPPTPNTMFVFENNSISKFENASLLTHPAYQLRTDAIKIDRACVCPSLWRWTLTLIGHVNPSLDEGIVHSPHPPPPEADALFIALQCRPDDREKYAYFSQVEQKCKSMTSESGIGIIVIVVLVGLGLALLITLIAIFWLRRKRRKTIDKQRQGKAWIGVPTHERQKKNRESGACADEDTSVMVNGSSEPRGKEYAVVMPDLRTYRETEFHVIVERVEPLPMDGNKEEYHGPKSQLLENEDYSDAEKTSL